MTASVDLTRLAEKLSGRRLAYLTTADAECQVHTIPVTPVFNDGVVEVGPIGGKRTRANLSHSKRVSLLWPPAEADGYTVIVDGQADVSEIGNAQTSLKLTPGHAVLIRLAASDTSADACDHDWVDLALAVTA